MAIPSDAPGGRAVVVDAEPLWVDGLAAALGRAGVEVEAPAVSAREAALVVATGRARLVAVGRPVDVDLLAALDVLGRLRPRPVLLAFADGRDVDVAALVARRPDALLLRSATATEVGGALERVRAGERVVATPLAVAVASERSVPAPVQAGDRAEALTAREREVLALVGRGCSNREIASRLCVAEATVKSTLTRTYRKLGVGDRTAAVRRAVELELLG